MADSGFFNNFGGGQIILIPHLVVFFIAYRNWIRRAIVWSFWPVVLDVLGVMATLMSFMMSMAFLFDTQSPAGTGSVGSWYVIYGVVTLGVVPVLGLWIYYLSGRFVGRVMQLYRLRKLRGNLGRQSDASA